MLKKEIAQLKGNTKLGVMVRSLISALNAFLSLQAFANALLIVPKTLAQNSNYPVEETIMQLVEAREQGGIPVGINLDTGKPFEPSVSCLARLCKDK